MKVHQAIYYLIAITGLLLASMLSCTFKQGLLSNQNTANQTRSLTKPLVTFIIPTIGRSTLKRTISSLQAQNNPNWEAIIVFDSLAPQNITSDPRVKAIQTFTARQYNYGGEVRNQGMAQVTTPWIAFVDDDDALSPDYIDHLLAESRQCPDLETVVFRMYHPTLKRIIPAPEQTNLAQGHVGISFCMKTSLYQAGFKFTPGPTEDFQLLDKIQKAGHKMVLSPYVTYWIRGATKQPGELPEHTYTRVYIN